MADFNITDSVDITDVVCPVTFVKAKIGGVTKELKHQRLSDRKRC